MTPKIDELSEAKKLLLARGLRGLGALQHAEQIQPRPVGAKTVISVDQYRIWLHASMQPELATYNEPVTIRYRGTFDLAILKASLDYFLKRHEAWRTSFEVQHEEVLQVVHDEAHIAVASVDLTHLPVEEREREAEKLATKQALDPIDISKVPLLRALTVRVAEDDHRLYLVLHHIVFDGLSIRETFIPELATIYAALQLGVEPSLPVRTLQYCDYSVWRQEHANSAAMERHLDYWKQQLAGELPLLRLPIDRARPTVINQRGSIEQFELSGELTAALRELSQAQGVTLYMTMLAAFKAVLFRYSGQEDVIVGGGVDGRRRPELRGMVGYLLDTFPVRTHPFDRLPFSMYLSRVKQAVIGALDAAEVPFDRVVQAVGIKRDSSYHPIFQSFFSFLSTGGALPAGWEMRPKETSTGAAKFDVYLEVEELPTHTAACIIYNTDLFDAATIQRMAGHWTTLMEGICKTPDAAIGDLPLLTEAESEQMLVRWNAQETPLPAATMHGLVEEQVRRTPNKIAVEFEGRSWTYAELDGQAEMLAAHLRRAGAGPNRLVAICLDRSEYLLASLLGVLKTGAAYLPLDPATPSARIVLCMEDAAPAVVLTQRSVVHALPDSAARILILEDLLKALPEVDEAAPHVVSAVGPDDTAYVIHTSGSTGRPKGVELPHGAVVNLLLSMQREPGFTAADTLVAVTTVSFDIAVLELFLPLITGGRVVIASRGTMLDPHKLAALIDATNCTVMQATPATWRALLAIDWPGRAGMRVLCGGEAMPRDLADKLLTLGLELWNVYGPTETTIWSTAYLVQPGVGGVPIGRPIANTTIYILDANEQPVPIGVPGELYIGGVGLAKGYRDQPELTAQKFVTPAIAKGERLYRTGDYAVYRADGTISCQGRADNQVKIRGHRVEWEEVELHLSAHPAIASAAARVWADPSGSNRLSAYFVAKNGAAPSALLFREFLRNRVPEYMIPSDFTVLETMPLTPNGKMDRKALPSPYDLTALRVESSQPLNEVEEKLAKIWAQALGVKNVQKDDNFFDLGGHSLLLVLLFSRINKEFASNLPITTIFDAQTLSSLAIVLKEKVRISSLVPVQTAGSKPPLFMAHSYLLYHGLSSALGSDQPFYGLRELEQDGDLAISERARRYAADMRKVQPNGPYRIAGWCAAGPMAVEISRQLIRAGEQVALLELFDAWLPGYAESLEQAEREKSYTGLLKGKLALLGGKLRGLSLRAKARYVGRVVWRMVRETRDEFYIRNWGQMNNLSRRLNVPLPQFMHNTTLQTFAAMREFEAEGLPVRITLIRATDSRQISGASTTCGWETVAERGVDVLWAPGDHETMFRGENLKVTAKLVRESLEKATAEQAVDGSSTTSFGRMAVSDELTLR